MVCSASQISHQPLRVVLMSIGICYALKFAYSGVHIRVKWAKNIQAPEKQHWVKLPMVENPDMCPVRAISALLHKFRLKDSNPLLILNDYQLLLQSHLRSRLATFLRAMGLPLEGHGFHTIRRSATTISNDANASLTAIKVHGLWHSDAFGLIFRIIPLRPSKFPLLFNVLSTTYNKCILGFGLFSFVFTTLFCYFLFIM